MPGDPRTPAELATLGVARVSLGAGIYRTLYGRLADLAGRLAAGASPYPG
jgi:2-methylisocitrate lyase-like PEP mutase family enzyme